MSVFWFLGMASLLSAFRDPHVHPPPLRPLRDGLVVLASFIFFLVFVFLSVYLFLLLAFLSQFGLSSSSPSVAILCSSSWPRVGFDVLLLEPWSSSSVPVWAGCVALKTHNTPLFLFPASSSFLPLPSFLLLSPCLLLLFSLLFFSLLSPLPGRAAAP